MPCFYKIDSIPQIFNMQSKIFNCLSNGKHHPTGTKSKPGSLDQGSFLCAHLCTLAFSILCITINLYSEKYSEMENVSNIHVG